MKKVVDFESVKCYINKVASERSENYIKKLLTQNNLSDIIRKLLQAVQMFFEN